jgi:mannose-1-phosphate guanylyltransferase
MLSGQFDIAGEHRWGVILSGGDGMRLRSLTRLLTGDDRPKQFCTIVGAETLLAQTRQRVARIVRPERTLFVVAKSHAPFYGAELGQVPLQRMVVQPGNRGTLPAILWSLMRLVRLDRHSTVAFFPSDHHYSHEAKFIAKVASAFSVAEADSRVIVLGAPARTPETEYGWIEPEATKGASSLMRVRRFWEKPSRRVAQALLERGCLWNTFVMVGRAGAFLELIRSAEPGLYETFLTVVLERGADMNPESMETTYDGIETADFSKRILSRVTAKLAVQSLGDIGWNDLGEPRRVRAIMSSYNHPQLASAATAG